MSLSKSLTSAVSALTVAGAVAAGSIGALPRESLVGLALRS